MLIFNQMTVLLIGVIQVSSAKPLAPEPETDPAKLFSADELERARNAGLSDRHLVTGKVAGFTLDEMVKIKPLMDTWSPKNVAFDFTSKLCKVLISGPKTASNHTSAHEVSLKNLMKTGKFLPDDEYLHFLQTKVCDYVSQPDAHSFDKKFVTQEHIRSLKKKAKNATGAARVQLAKEICCVNDGGDMLDPTCVCSLNNNEIQVFDKHWNEFEATNELSAFKKVCDFIDDKNPTDGECLVEVTTEIPKANSI